MAQERRNTVLIQLYLYRDQFAKLKKLKDPQKGERWMSQLCREMVMESLERRTTKGKPSGNVQ